MARDLNTYCTDQTTGTCVLLLPPAAATLSCKTIGVHWTAAVVLFIHNQTDAHRKLLSCP